MVFCMGRFLFILGASGMPGSRDCTALKTACVYTVVLRRYIWYCHLLIEHMNIICHVRLAHSTHWFNARFLSTRTLTYIAKAANTGTRPIAAQLIGSRQEQLG
jgi:hypothetical protein